MSVQANILQGNSLLQEPSVAYQPRGSLCYIYILEIKARQRRALQKKLNHGQQYMDADGADGVRGPNAFSDV